MKSKILSLLLLLPGVLFAAPPPDLPHGWSESYVYANGIRIHYYRGAPAPGKQVILAVHGVMDTGLTWASVGMKLQKNYDLYMLDTRGHGLSDPSNGSEDGNTLLMDVMAAAKALHLDKPILMGHSMGAATVMRIGAEYPDFARAIVMLDPGIGPHGRAPAGQNGPRPARPAATAPRESSAPGRISITMRGSPETMVAQNNYSFEDLVAKAHHDNPKWSTMDCRYWAVAIKRYHGPYSDQAWQPMSGAMRTEDALAKIKVPALVLKAGADASAETRQAMQDWVSGFKNVKLVYIDGAHHNLQRDQPERTVEVLTQFLENL